MAKERGSLSVSLPMLLMGLVLSGCASAKSPIYLNPGFKSLAIEEITVLPAVDARLDKTQNVDLQKQIRQTGANFLERKGYQVSQQDDLGGATELTEEILKAPDPEWVKHLGPPGARWVMVLTLDDLTTKLTFGSTGSAELSGVLYDRTGGSIVWRDKGIAQVGQAGLIGMALKGTMGGEAVRTALFNLLASFPKRSK